MATELTEFALEPLPAEAAALLGYFDGPTVVLSRDYHILAANEAYRRDYGGGDTLCGRLCYAVSHHYDIPCDLAGETCPLRNSVDTGQRQRVLHVHHTPRGAEHVDVETVPIRGPDGGVLFLVEHLRPAHAASILPGITGMVGRSTAFNRMLELIQRVAPSRTAVLLQGESGTGKELAAQAIHDQSLNADGPFVPVECSGLSETLFESELFGHEKGAFTGAVARKPGLVEAARGGTLLLDEVGDIPLTQQVKLLRLLETGTYRPVGSVSPHKADFRLVCATHRDLKAMIQEGAFRQDLYYRISTFPVALPPLRERTEDLPLLVEALLRRIAGDRRITVDPWAMACLEAYTFPGNVRELRNILEHGALLADGDVIYAAHLPGDCGCVETATSRVASPGGAIVTLEAVEQRYLQQVVARHHGDRRSLARKLGVSERTLYRKLEALKRLHRSGPSHRR